MTSQIMWKREGRSGNEERQKEERQRGEEKVFVKSSGYIHINDYAVIKDNIFVLISM